MPAASDQMIEEAIDRFLKDPRGTMSASELPPDVQKALDAASGEVRLSDATIEKQRFRHDDLSAADHRRLPQILRAPHIVAKQGTQHVLILKEADALYRAVVKTTANGQENYLVSFHRTSRAAARRALRDLEILVGSREMLDKKRDDGAPVGPARNPT